MSKVWVCKIGTDENVEIPKGADAPMRQAVQEAFEKVTGVGARYAFTGWGGQLTKIERSIVDDTHKDEPLDGALFEDLCRPLIEYMASHHHPHTKVIVTNVGAELMTGEMGFHTEEFLKG
jgi:hypothetical protein